VRRLLLPLFLTILVIPMLGARRRVTLPPHGPTFNREVVRILQQNCQSCHRPGDIAPFSLLTYQDAAARADEIKFMTKTRQMPPWKAAEGCGDFVGVRAMSAQDIATIAAWADAGAPEGNAADLPAALTFNDSWALGTPDLVLSMPKPFTPPPDRDEYRCYSIPASATQDLWVSAIDFRPGDRGTVHHIVPFLDTTGASAKLDKNGNGYQCFGGSGLTEPDVLGAWSPGARVTPLPSGTAVLIPKGSRVIMQVHYHPHFGKVLPDQTEIGLYTAKEEVRKRMHYDFAANTQFVLKAGVADQRVDAFVPLPEDIELVSIYPHMHLLGKRMSVEAILPDGSKVCMIDVPKYEFNWQGAYLYRNPLALPHGSQIHIEAHYDNSDDNINNPNTPPRDVRWGEASTDEMCIALVGYTTASGN
jgi:hypothetical protein